MDHRTLGKTGLQVSPIGIGLAEIGKLSPDEKSGIEILLNTALDSGVNILDTAALYGISEEMIGETVSRRRDEYVLATKCGQDDPGRYPWTRESVENDIDASLRRLKTDHVDILQLHSCGVDVLERGEVIDALLKARDDGKTRFVGYSGDNEAAAWAVESGIFDTLQTSYNVVDQKARKTTLPAARAAGMGVIIKRPITNGIFGNPAADESSTKRFSIMSARAAAMSAGGPIPGAPDDRILLCLGFTMAREEVDVAIVGTMNPEHLKSNIRLFEEQIPISEVAVEELYRRFDQLGDDWEGLI